jgi:hypothetical protein
MAKEIKFKALNDGQQFVRKGRLHVKIAVGLLTDIRNGSNAVCLSGRNSRGVLASFYKDDLVIPIVQYDEDYKGD